MAADPSASSAPPSQLKTMITDLNEDSLSHCATYLTLQDLSNLAITCKSLKRAAYSDSIWQYWFRKHWPQELVSYTSRMREMYLERRVAVQQFKFVDPLVADFVVPEAKPFDHIILDNNDIVFSQGSLIQTANIDNFINGRDCVTALTDHKARVTCMRLFPLNGTSLFRSETQRKENILVTSSCDHSIRLWWKGSCKRCFRGHNGPVSILSDKLLGDGNAKVLASGGEDGTVRLWSLSSSGKRDQHALKATLYGHEKPIKLMAVAGHRTSLLATISKDSKVRVWDTATSSAVRSSCCVGMTSVPSAPVDVKCHESMLYVAAGSFVVGIDLRTMQKVITAAIYQPKLCAFAIMPSKPLICTGGIDKAMLWDLRRNQKTLKPEPVVELDGHTGPVKLLHMDPYKIVTGGPYDSNICVWETDSGMITNSFLCCPDKDASTGFGSTCSAMAVNGTRIVTASYGLDHGHVCFRDFLSATCPVSKREDEHASKFWVPQSYYDGDADSSDG